MPHPPSIKYSDHGEDRREQLGLTLDDVREALAEGQI
jgi:hypothetical protein